MSAPQAFDVVVIGGGAAGLFCAFTAGRRGRRVAVLDHADKLGKKILISGGGRCNFTNRDASPANYLSANPHFCRSALARYTPADFISLVESHGIAYHEKKLGQLFCDGSAKEILALLLRECAEAQVEIVCGAAINSVQREPVSDGRFIIASSRGEFSAASVVVATGGLSIPTIGATDLGYRLATQFGLRLVATTPGLVPFTLPPSAGVADLSGLSADTVVRAGAAEFREHILFTHAGLSGPAILQASSYWQPGETVEIDLLPEHDLPQLVSEAKRAGVKTMVSTLLSEHLPKRLVARFCERHGDEPVAQLPTAVVTALADGFHRWQVRPAGTEGYRKAEVTRGGVDTRDLSSQTMAARDVPGLHFIGEVVDVTGWLGGYNFQWAWASGHAAGSAA